MIINPPLSEADGYCNCKVYVSVFPNFCETSNRLQIVQGPTKVKGFF